MKTPTNPATKTTLKKSSPASIARRNDYATKYYWCVEKVAKRLARRLPSYIDVNDLISAGAVGLMEAADRFDPARCERFEAFAEVRIRGAMLDDIRVRDTLSRDMRRISNELRSSTNQLAQQLGRTPREEEVAERLGISLHQLRARQVQLSGSSVIGIDDAGPNFLERTAGDGSDDPCEQAARRELFHQMMDRIGELPDKLQQVLSLYYADNLNLKEIGAVLGVTESRVCQLHGEATKRLRVSLGTTFFQEAAAA